jgi:hypothetical protein
MLIAAREWSQSTGAPYWPPRANKEWQTMTDALALAENNISRTIASRLSLEKVTDDARAYLRAVEGNSRDIQNFRNEQMSLAYIVLMFAKTYNLEKILNSLMRFYSGGVRY